MLKKGKGDLGLDLLGLFYKECIFREEHIRRIANMGFRWIRIFNASKDQMKLADYNQKHYDNVERISDKLLKVDRKLIIDFSGYTNENFKIMNHDEIVELFIRTYRKIKRFIPIDSLFIQPVNELNFAPRGFKYKPKKPGMAGQMERICSQLER